MGTAVCNQKGYLYNVNNTTYLNEILFISIKSKQTFNSNKWIQVRETYLLQI